MALLGRGRWYPPNHAALSSWIAEVARRPAPPPKVAVFDWDNTSMANDVGVVSARYQLDRLEMRLSPEALDELLPRSVNGVSVLASGVSMADLAADIVEAYRGVSRGTRAHKDFRAKMLYLYDAFERTPGIGTAFAYPWLTTWLRGFSAREIEALAARAAASARREKVEIARWTSASAGRAGRVSVEIEKGLAPQEEMIDLMTALRAAGVRVFVVSASQQELVRGVAAHFRYPIAAEDIYGIRLDAPPDYPVTNGPGKVACISRFLPAPPIFVAGDSDGDYDMLTAFPETELRLVVNRNKSPSSRTATLYTAARTGDPRTLLQGRNEQTLLFARTQNTRPRPSA